MFIKYNVIYWDIVRGTMFDLVIIKIYSGQLLLHLIKSVWVNFVTFNVVLHSAAKMKRISLR